MVFANDTLPNMFNKIIQEINNTTIDKLGIKELRRIIIKFRLTLDDTDFFIQYLQDHGIIKRKGSIIYLLDKQTIAEPKKPGRHSKLSEEEKRYIKENYVPYEHGIYKIANEINQKRDDDVSHMAIARVLQT